MPALVIARCDHACCTVRGNLVVLGGRTGGGHINSTSVEMLSKGGGEFVQLPSLSYGKIYGAAAIAVEESASTAGQVLLLGGMGQGGVALSTVQLVDLASGVCTPHPQPVLLNERCYSAAARLPDGRVICAGGSDGPGGQLATVEMWAPPLQGMADAAWAWRALPAMSVELIGCCGCVMSDGRFAVFGGRSNNVVTSSCEALKVGTDEHWEPLPPMHDSRYSFACAAVAGCVIVVGGRDQATSEVYDEVLNRWLRLPSDLPHAPGHSGLWNMSSALL
jgi:hypothetical protein